MSEIDYRRQLGRITKAKLWTEDHGIFQLMLRFEFGGSVQSFAPLLWSRSEKMMATEEGRAKLGRLAMGCWEMVYDIYDLFGVSEASEIEEMVAYALREKNGFGEYIMGIERIEADGSKIFSLGAWREKWGFEQ